MQNDPVKAARVLSNAIHTHGYAYSGVWASAAGIVLARLPEKAKVAVWCSAAANVVAGSVCNKVEG